jgi:1-deoxy-D-xylulose-5-phosphate synthase
LQRAYDQILHDVALQKLPVVFCVDRAGLNAADGATHHGIFDVAYLSQVPDLVIDTPVTEDALRLSLAQALKRDMPSAIRYPNGTESDAVLSRFYPNGLDGHLSCRADFDAADTEAIDAVIVTDGRIVSEAMIAAARWKETWGKRAGLVLIERLKPYDLAADFLAQRLPDRSIKVLFVEEDIRAGGMGMMLSELLSRRYPEKMANKTTKILAPEDSFVIRSRPEPIYDTAGVSADCILQTLM